MENPIEKLNRIQPDFDFDDLIDFSDENDVAISSIVRDAASEGTATNAGVKTVSLQSAMDNYAHLFLHFICLIWLFTMPSCNGIIFINSAANAICC